MLKKQNHHYFSSIVAVAIGRDITYIRLSAHISTFMERAVASACPPLHCADNALLQSYYFAVRWVAEETRMELMNWVVTGALWLSLWQITRVSFPCFLSQLLATSCIPKIATEGLFSPQSRQDKGQYSVTNPKWSLPKTVIIQAIEHLSIWN